MQPCRDGAEFRPRPVLTTKTRAVPLRTDEPRKTVFVRSASEASAAIVPGRFLDWKGLTRHAGFTDQKVLRLNHDAISRDQVASRQ